MNSSSNVRSPTRRISPSPSPARHRKLTVPPPHAGLEASSSPYSKSHERRLKRRAKEQVASGLDDIKAALSAVDVAVPQTIQEALESESAEATASRPRTTQGQIGEGKAAPLSKAQRKRAL